MNIGNKIKQALGVGVCGTSSYRKDLGLSKKKEENFYSEKVRKWENKKRKKKKYTVGDEVIVEIFSLHDYKGELFRAEPDDSEFGVPGLGRLLWGKATVYIDSVHTNKTGGEKYKCTIIDVRETAITAGDISVLIGRKAILK